MVIIFSSLILKENIMAKKNKGGNNKNNNNNNAENRSNPMSNPANNPERQNTQTQNKAKG